PLRLPALPTRRSSDPSAPWPSTTACTSSAKAEYVVQPPSRPTATSGRTRGWTSRVASHATSSPMARAPVTFTDNVAHPHPGPARSEEHTSELQSRFDL